MNSARLLAVLGGAAAVAACVPKTEAPPPPPQPPVTQPVRPPPPPPPADWRDAPLTPGGWIYRSEGSGSQALFGPTGGTAAFAVRCDRASSRVSLIRDGVGSGNTMAIRTNYGARNLPVTAQPQGLVAALSARDRLLDEIAFSRGRFTVEAPGLPVLIIPAWPEPARVIEDCRG